MSAGSVYSRGGEDPSSNPNNPFERPGVYGGNILCPVVWEASHTESLRSTTRVRVATHTRFVSVNSRDLIVYCADPKGRYRWTKT